MWQVAWAHPRFGNILASCSYDRRVFIWQEGGGQWSKIYEYTNHESSVNSVQWAPHDHGLVLACGSSDGAISVLTYSANNTWESEKINNAHTIGCNAVSWSPCLGSSVRRLVSGGCDSLVKIWRQGEDGHWTEEAKLEAHSDWVRDTAWAPSLGSARQTIASCGQDRRVVIWTQREGGSWVPKILHTFEDVVWHVSWSVSGNILAVSGGDNKVSDGGCSGQSDCRVLTCLVCRSPCGRRVWTSSGTASLMSAKATLLRDREGRGHLATDIMDVMLPLYLLLFM